MNREIKFRGKSVDNGEWVYGDLMYNAHCNERASILYVPRVIDFPGQICNVPIIKDTICQFTGLHDNDGKDIYEGDIVSILYWKGVVVYNNEYASFNVRCVRSNIDIKNLFVYGGKIIGNIHDNPELLQ